MAEAALPGEAQLMALAGRFVEAEERIRQLLARAPAGDRRRLLELALEVLLDLRREVTRSAVAGTLAAYATASLATSLLTGRPSPAPDRALDLGRGLALGLDRAIVTAEAGSRQAFAGVREETLRDAAQDAVTARIDRAGARQPLGHEGRMRTSTVARHATSRATADTLGPDGLVEISSHGTTNPICAPLEGIVIPSSGSLPPYHARCAHVAIPAASTRAEHVAAMAEVANEARAIPARA